MKDDITRLRPQGEALTRRIPFRRGKESPCSEKKCVSAPDRCSVERMFSAVLCWFISSACYERMFCVARCSGLRPRVQIYRTTTPFSFFLFGTANAATENRAQNATHIF